LPCHEPGRADAKVRVLGGELLLQQLQAAGRSSAYKPAAAMNLTDINKDSS
jgi:hypothetical protein